MLILLIAAGEGRLCGWSRFREAIDPKSLRFVCVHKANMIFFLKKNPLRSIFFCMCVFSCREGRNQYEKAFGVESKDLFQALYR